MVIKEMKAKMHVGEICSEIINRNNEFSHSYDLTSSLILVLSLSSFSSRSTRVRCFNRNHDSLSMFGCTSSSSSLSSILSHFE